MSIEKKYTKKSLHEHILSLPDTYIGSNKLDKQELYIYDNNRIIKKTIDFIPGLYKIFDEVLVNASDQTVRTSACNVIKIYVNSNEICVQNNGSDIPIEIHKEHEVYVPELIFGNLLTSSNYEVTGKIVGGKNGYGAKLANIYSTEFNIEFVDSTRKKKYTQKFTNNMFNKEEPVITSTKKKDESYAKITFKPDFAKFGVECLSDDMISLFKKRAYDIAACTTENVKVYINDELISIKSFENYIEKFYEDSDKPNYIYEVVNDRWTIGLVYDNSSGYNQVSFVNGICTYLGGTHVNYIKTKIINALSKNKKFKDLTIKPALITEFMTIYIKCSIEDPSFNSQTKDILTTKSSEFGSRCEISDKFITSLSKTGIIDDIVQMAKLKESMALKKSDGKKKTSLLGIPNLIDAKLAGTKYSKECCLICTEGLSAMVFARSGLEIVGRDRFGIFPLKGKLLNVREASNEQIKNNAEIKHLKQIFGLKQGENYTEENFSKQLRYGKIVILTDQDVDGSHIKGLLINFFHFFWPSLFKIDTGFIQCIKTPIIKVFNKSDKKREKPTNFFTVSEYRQWIEDKDSSNFIIKYYKGLGTSKDSEAKESFKDFYNQVITYIWNNDDVCNDAITLAFNKTRSNDRKCWLQSYNKDDVLNDETKIGYNDFIHKELIHFSNYDNIRSIPSFCDGLKPSQRKIIYSCFKRNIFSNEIKVAQLAAYVSENTDYHHGEASLQGAIINLAQDFVGSNNINLLLPNGNFGTRNTGGKDAASSRYIFTQLNEITGKIFRKEDSPLLNYLVEEGYQIEPEYYFPIIPSTLINGGEGIGTGFSTDIPSYNPKDIVKNLKKLIDHGSSVTLKSMIPWYRNFKGEIIETNTNKFESHGVVSVVNSTTLRITELPIGVWTENYIKFLESCVTKNIITDIDDNSGNDFVDITITLPDGQIGEMTKSENIMKTLKLTSAINATNLHLNTSDLRIKKYMNVHEILVEYYEFRLDIYEKRKDYYIKLLENQMNILKWKRKFIQHKIDKVIIIEDRSRDEIIDRMIELGFPKLSPNTNSEVSYRYITDMQLFSMTKEKIKELDDEIAKKNNDLDAYKNTTIEDMWKTELDEFIESFNKFCDSNKIGTTPKKKSSKKLKK